MSPSGAQRRRKQRYLEQGGIYRWSVTYLTFGDDGVPKSHWLTLDAPTLEDARRLFLGARPGAISPRFELLVHSITRLVRHTEGEAIFGRRPLDFQRFEKG